jgi:hypothetical protein
MEDREWRIEGGERKDTILYPLSSLLDPLLDTVRVTET